MTFPVSLALFANAGLPMISLAFPAMLMLLIPVVIVEGLLCRKWLRLTTWEAMKSNAVSNLASTIFGIPLAWVIMFAVELISVGILGQFDAAYKWHSPLAQVIWVLVGSAWIGSLGREHAIWPIPAATLVLLVPFFLASYAIEYRVMKSIMRMREGGPPELPDGRVRIAVRNANLITYGAMFVAATVWLIFSLPKHR